MNSHLEFATLQRARKFFVNLCGPIDFVAITDRHEVLAVFEKKSERVIGYLIR